MSDTWNCYRCGETTHLPGFCPLRPAPKPVTKCSRGVYGCSTCAEPPAPEPCAPEAIEDRPTVALPAEERRPPTAPAGLAEGWQTVLLGVRTMWRAVRG